MISKMTSWNKNGVGGVATLFREWLVRVAFYYEQLKEIAGECYKQYCDVNEYIWALLNNA